MLINVNKSNINAKKSMIYESITNINVYNKK